MKGLRIRLVESRDRWHLVINKNVRTLLGCNCVRLDIDYSNRAIRIRAATSGITITEQTGRCGIPQFYAPGFLADSSMRCYELEVESVPEGIITSVAGLSTKPVWLPSLPAAEQAVGVDIVGLSNTVTPARYRTEGSGVVLYIPAAIQHELGNTYSVTPPDALGQVWLEPNARGYRRSRSGTITVPCAKLPPALLGEGQWDVKMSLTVGRVLLSKAA